MIWTYHSSPSSASLVAHARADWVQGVVVDVQILLMWMPHVWRKVKGFDVPYIKSELRDAINERDKIKILASKTQDDVMLSRYKVLRTSGKINRDEGSYIKAKQPESGDLCGNITEFGGGGRITWASRAKVLLPPPQTKCYCHTDLQTKVVLFLYPTGNLNQNRSRQKIVPH